MEIYVKVTINDVVDEDRAGEELCEQINRNCDTSYTIDSECDSCGSDHEDEEDLYVTSAEVVSNYELRRRFGAATYTAVVPTHAVHNTH